jgi:hypothetical protein
MASRKAERERLRRERVERERQAARSQRRRRRLTRLGATLAALLVVSAGAIALGTRGGEGEGSAGPTGGEAARIADVHGIGVNPADRALYIATHSGLFRSAEGESSATRVPALEQDLMGFSVAGPDRFVASGHPGPGQNAPPSLGLIESTDRGRTWMTVSLAGEADLHVLRASGGRVYAYDGALRVSTDGGRSWQQRGVPGDLIDIAIDPANEARVLASTVGGVRISADGGRTWRETSLEAAVLLAWGETRRPFAIEGDGTVHGSRDGGVTWQSVGTYGGRPAAFAAGPDGALYVAQGDGAVDSSTDGGRTWRPRSRN